MSEEARGLAALTARLLGVAHVQVVLVEPTSTTVLARHGEVPEMEARVAEAFPASMAPASYLEAERQEGRTALEILVAAESVSGRTGLLVGPPPQAAPPEVLTDLGALLELVCRAGLDERRRRHLAERQKRQDRLIAIQEGILRRIARREALEEILSAILDIPPAYGRPLGMEIRVIAAGEATRVSRGLPEGEHAPTPAALAAEQRRRAVLMQVDKGYEPLTMSLAVPIHSAAGSHLGVLELFYPLRDAPTPIDFRVLEAASQLASVAIDGANYARELEQTRRAAAQIEKLAAIGTLVAGVAHEVNNPLQIMGGNADLIQMLAVDVLDRGNLDDDVRENLTDIAQKAKTVGAAVEQVAHITRNLKRTARPSTTLRVPLDANQLVMAVTDIVANQAPSHVVLETRLESTRMVLGSDTDLAQVLLNLLLNAFAALSTRAAGRVVVRTADADDGHVTIRVEDDGPGIPPAIQAKMFTPFNTSRAEGTGLGLAISRRLALDNGGDLGYVTTLGKGTVFTLSLPCASDKASAERPAGPAARPR